ncbi:hypothetical protein PG994_013024 [Apiospora phragmitis]|uniref:Uncharacterized protein n=1 Tax=Apiospora phragmitis TaxID=2905665 RepID=A0ABR1T7G4_9PEZI
MNIPQVIKPLETKQERVAKLARHLAQTDRLRHIWLADAPPHYPSVYAATRVKDLLKEQILQAREKRRAAQVLPPNADSLADDGGIKAPKSIRQLLERTPPPPAVIAFTPRPTYFLTRYSPLRDIVGKGGDLSRLRLLFPRLPEWLPTAQSRHRQRDAIPANSTQNQATTTTTTATTTSSSTTEDPYDHIYETEVRPPLDGRMPPFSGPGRLMLWTVADLQQRPSTGFSPVGKGQEKGELYSWAATLAQATTNLLKFDFGILARPDPSYSGLWVRRGHGPDVPERQIAAIWPHVEEESAIVTAGITLNVGLPREVQLFAGEDEEGKEAAAAAAASEKNDGPEDPDGNDHDKDEDTTSIAAELAARPPGFQPKMWPESNLVNVGKHPPAWWRHGASSPSDRPRPVWYTRAIEKGGRTGSVGTFAPLGIDNYGISVAWSVARAGADAGAPQRPR